MSGALAAGDRARTHDAVVLKTPGATRAMLDPGLHVRISPLLGAATAIFALVAGGGVVRYVLSRIMKLSPLLPDVAFMTLVIALVTTIGIGLAGTAYPRAKSNLVLREL